MAIARMIVRSGLLTFALMSAVATTKAIAALRDYLLDQTISPSERDLNECVVDLGRDLGATPLRRDPPSLV